MKLGCKRGSPAAQFGVIVLTTSAGIMDHEEARRKKVGGKVRPRGRAPALFAGAHWWRVPSSAVVGECGWRAQHFKVQLVYPACCDVACQ